MTVQAIAADATSTTANQHGQLTPEQQRRVTTLVKLESTPRLFGAGVFVFLFGIILLSVGRSPTAGISLRDLIVFGGLFGLTVLLFAARVWWRQRALNEVRAGRLMRAEGHIEWQGGVYRAHVPGHTLNLSAFNLGIGTYAFSFLPSSGRVIAAELVALDTPAQAQDELRHALAVANHFNVDDLPAYRTGGLGQAGPRRLRQSWSGTGWLVLAAVICLLVFVYMVNAHMSKELAPGVFVAAMFLGLWALVEGQAYRVYFVPRSKQLVGVEPV